MPILNKIRKLFVDEIRAVHELRCWPDPFAAARRGDKPYEIRRHDRDFEVGDLLILREYDPQNQCYSGRMLYRQITHITSAGAYGLPEGLCVLGIK